MRTLVRLSVVLLVLFAACPLDTVQGDEDDPKLRLSRARDKEFDQRNYPKALELYRALLEDPGLQHAVRGAAMLGVGRCLHAMGQSDEAEKIWLAIRRPASTTSVRAKLLRGEKRMNYASPSGTNT